MELHQLEYFVAVAETGSFSRGAERSCIAQPSLSQQIAKLERELGQRLFDRLGRRIALTDAGRLLLGHARNVLASVAAVKRTISDNLRDGCGRLAVGAIPTIAPYVLPRALRRLRAVRPHAELQVVENLTPALIESLVAAELDVCLLSGPVDDHRIATEALWTEPLFMAVGRDHSLAGAAGVSLCDLADQPAIVLHEMHCLGQQIEAFCRETRRPTRIFCRSTQLSTIQSLIALGLGVSVVPQMMADADASGSVVYLPFADRPRPERAITAAWNPLRAASSLIADFLEAVRLQEVSPDSSAPVGRAGTSTGANPRRSKRKAPSHSSVL